MTMHSVLPKGSALLGWPIELKAHLYTAVNFYTEELDEGLPIFRIFH